MAAENLIGRYSFPASADYSTAATYQYHFMKLDTSGNLVITGAGDKMVGILQDTPASGVAGEVGYAGISRLVVDGNAAAIACGDYLKSDASGQGVKTTTNGDEVGAIALQASTAAGDIIAVEIVRFRY